MLRLVILETNIEKPGKIGKEGVNKVAEEEFAPRKK